MLSVSQGSAGAHLQLIHDEGREFIPSRLPIHHRAHAHTISLSHSNLRRGNSESPEGLNMHVFIICLLV